MKIFLYSCSAIALNFVFLGAAQAADAPQPSAGPEQTSGSGAEVAEITVTATRRESSLQRTPVTVSAFSGNDLAKLGVTRVDQIAAQVPNFYAQPGVANASTLSLGMRGHGNNEGGFGTTEQPVSFYFDDIFAARPSVVNQDFSDVERVEVLRGPQGTLFGRNSMVGAVNVISRTPGAEAYGNFAASYGNYETTRLRGAYGTPIADNLAVSLAGTYTHQGKGYMDNVTTGDTVDRRNFWGVRGKVHYFDGDHIDLVIAGGHTNAKNDGFVTTSYDIAANQPVPTGDYRKTASPLDTYGLTKTNFVNSHFTAKFDGFTFRSITGWSNVQDGWQIDLTGGIQTPTGEYTTGYGRKTAMKQRQWSQESQIFGDALDGKATWIAGLYLFHELTSQRFDDNFYLASIDTRITVPTISYTMSTYSYAGYAQGTYEVLPGLQAVVGARYTLEDKHIAGHVDPETPYGAHQTYHAFTPKFGLNYQASPDAFLYGTVSKGFKAGSYGAGSSTVEIAETGYRPESIWAYEVGAKTQWLDRKVRLNLAGFVNDFTDVVSSRFLPNSGIVVLFNGQSYRAAGVEVEFAVRPIPELNVYVNGGYQHISRARFVEGSTVTRKTSQPSYSGTAGFRYEAPLASDLKLRFGGDWTFRDGFYGSDDRAPITYFSKVSEIGAEVTLLSDKGWQVSAIGQNLTNRTEWKNSLDLVDFLGVGSRQPQLPRTYRIEASFHF